MDKLSDRCLIRIYVVHDSSCRVKAVKEVREYSSRACIAVKSIDLIAADYLLLCFESVSSIFHFYQPFIV